MVTQIIQGEEQDNLKLSEERVKSISDYLIKNGIDAKRISYKGFGSNNPLVPNDTDINKAKNRKVEFVIK